MWRGSKPNAGGSTPNAWSISGGRRCTLDDMLCCLPVWLCDLQRNGSIYLLCGRVIVERVDTACWGVDAGCVVHVSWQAQHFSRCPLVFCCVYRSLAKLWFDISCICDRSGIVQKGSKLNAGVKTEGVFLCVSVRFCLSNKWFDIPTLNPSPPQSPP